ncbi:hypothetical protein L6R52_33385 [Myxococcota bacterium]|nr:hypothetical protein [Myxococcota bacterium]
MWARRAVVGLVVGLVACKGAEPISIDAPAGVDLISIVEVDASGAVVRATPVKTWPMGQGLPIVARPGPGTYVVGWRSDALAAAGAIMEELELEPVTAAAPCDLAIPTPTWTARWAASSTLEPVDPSVVPRLAAPWMRETCGGLGARSLVVDIPCAARRCTGSITPRGACALDVDLSACGLGVVRATVDHDGAVCLDTTRTPWTCEAPVHQAPSPAVTRCTAPDVCTIESYLVEPRAPPFELARVKVVDEGPYQPMRLRTPSDIEPWRLVVGHVLDLVVLEDRVIVSVTHRESVACNARRNEPSELRIFALETLELRATVLGPPCTERLVPDGRGGFLAPYLDVTGWRLGRFDRDATLVDSQPIGVEPLREYSGHAPRDIILRAASPRVVVLHGKPLPEEIRRPVVTLHDETTLVQSSSTTLELLQSYAIVEDTEGKIAVVSNDARTVGWFEVGDAQLSDPVRVPLDRGPFASLHEGVVDPTTGALFVFGQGEVHVDAITRGQSEPEPTAVASIPFELAITGAIWPTDPRRLVVAGATPLGEQVHQATLTFFDLDRRRFAPHAWSIGPGLPARMRTDARGRVWFIIPYASELVRLTPR